MNFALSGPFGPTYSANILIMMLILLFLTVPVILLLVDAQRNKKAKMRANPEEKIMEARVHGEIRSHPVVTAERVLEIVAADAVHNNFLNDKPPETMGYIPGAEHVMGPIRHRGYLQIAPHAVIEGNVHVAGSLALATGVEIYGDVQVTGELYLAPAARITGQAAVIGDVYLDRWSEVGDLETPSALHLGRGAQVIRRVAAERVTYDLLGGLAAPRLFDETTREATGEATLEEEEARAEARRAAETSAPVRSKS